MPSLVIEQPGLLTTVQDLGRPALRRLGLPPGGAVDRVALRVANLLVGNDENAAALECVLVGPVVRFRADADVAVAGARVAGVPLRQCFRVRAGERLTLSRLTDGAYAYLAIAGGLDLPLVLGSRSTDLRLRFGGHDGRALRPTDELSVFASRRVPTRERVDALRRDDFSRDATPPLDPARSPFPGVRVADLHDRAIGAPIRVLDGPAAGRVDTDWTAAVFTVSARSDRVGVRLDGPTLCIRTETTAASGPVFPGTIQLPRDGRPIVLLADAQTLGGYPQIGHVIAVDLPRLAQARPGRAVRFERVTLAEAHRLARRQERAFAFLRYGLRATMP